MLSKLHFNQEAADAGNAATHYIPPNRFDRAFNAVVGGLARLGSERRRRRDADRHRKTGRPQEIPANPLTLDDDEFLVAVRGETQWGQRTRHRDGRTGWRGRRVRCVILEEVAVADRARSSRARQVGWEVGWQPYRTFTPGASVDEIATEAAKLPVFIVRPAIDWRRRPPGRVVGRGNYRVRCGRSTEDERFALGDASGHGCLLRLRRATHRPTLRGRPVLVGGLGGRGVVAGASYEARVFGARSAMPMHQARRLVGAGAVVLPPRVSVYRKASERTFSIVREVIPVIEMLFDGAFGEPGPSWWGIGGRSHRVR